MAVGSGGVPQQLSEEIYFFIDKGSSKAEEIEAKKVCKRNRSKHSFSSS